MLILDPVGERGVFALPARQPGRQIAPATSPIVAAVVEPAQFLQAVVVAFSRHVVQGISEKVHVATLPGRLGKDFGDRLLETRVIVGDDELDARQAALLDG